MKSSSCTGSWPCIGITCVRLHVCWYLPVMAWQQAWLGSLLRLLLPGTSGGLALWWPLLLPRQPWCMALLRWKVNCLPGDHRRVLALSCTLDMSLLGTNASMLFCWCWSSSAGTYGSCTLHAGRWWWRQLECAGTGKNACIRITHRAVSALHWIRIGCKHAYWRVWCVCCRLQLTTTHLACPLVQRGSRLEGCRIEAVLAGCQLRLTVRVGARSPHLACQAL